MTNEQDFITELIKDFKQKFPGVAYKYQLIRDTHFFRVYFENGNRPEPFVFFSLEMYDKFSDLSIDNFLCITEEDTLVDLNDPSQFTWNKGVEQIPSKVIPNNNSDSLSSDEACQMTCAA